MSRALLIGVALLAACTELPAFEAGVCGNFVLDPGEDCDVASAECAQCRLQCPADVGAGEACSIDGYVCGLDGVCHAPSGRFGERATAVPLAGSSLAVTDIDRDGYGDVLALSATSLTVSYGESTGLGRQLSTLTPVVRGAPGFARLDDDDSLDVVLPTDDGVLAYSSPYGMLAPHPFPLELQVSASCSGMLGTPFHVFPASDRYVAVAYTDAQNDIGIAIIDAHGREVCPTDNFPDVCPNAPGASAREVDVYPLAPAGLRQGRVLAARTSEGLCAMFLEGPAHAEVGTFTVTPLTSPKALGSPRYPAIAGRPVLADLEQNDGCPSVVFSTGAGTSIAHHEYLGRAELGSCTLGTTPTAVPEDPDRVPSQVIGHFELLPAHALYGKDALVFASGASAVSVGANRVLRRLYRSDRALTDVRSGDFDDDGDVDVAAISAGNEDIDVLYRLPDAFGGAATPAELLRFRIDTLGPVGRFAVGDFDGNQADDVVFSEQAVASQRLLMAYGTRDRVLEPTTVGMYQNVAALCPLQAPASADPFGAVEDLLVLDIPGVGEPGGPLMLDASSRFTMLHGSPQRTMLSYFDPRPSGWIVHNMSTIGAVGVGRFSSRLDPVADLLALQVHKPYRGDGPLDNLIEPSARLYRLQNTGTGSFAYAEAVDTGQPGDVGECGPELEYRSCTNRARYLRWPVGDHDVAIAVDARDADRAAVFDPTSSSSVIRFSSAPDGVTKHHEVRSLHRIDSDGDGAYELLASFGGSVAHGADPRVALCGVGPDGVPLAPCADLATLLGRARCADAIPARIAPRGRLDPPPGPGTELVAVCDGQILRVFHDGAGYQAVPATPPVPELEVGMAQGELEGTHVGDVTGDGLDDLLVSVSETTRTTPLLLVFPQCAANDVACRADVVGGPGAAP